MQEGKCLSEEALQTDEKEEKWKAKERGKIHPTEFRVPEKSKEGDESLLK